MAIASPTCLSRPGRLAASLTVMVLVGACAVKAPPDVETLKKDTALPVPLGFTTVGPTPGLVVGGWIAGFGDEQLTAAVAEGIARSPDLLAGAARVEQAMLAAKQAGAKLWPSADLLARGGGKLSGDGSGLQGAVLSVNWELDLWARVRAGRAAVAADASGIALDYEYARQSLAGAVARLWFIATEAELQANTARDTIREAEDLVRLAQVRLDVGIGSDEDVSVARANAGTYRDALRQIEAARTESLRALELLIGRYPAAAIAVTSQFPGQPPSVPVGLPSDLLERRPDVVAAERRVAAAFHRIQEAKAARLPRIALTTGVSAISSDLFELKDHDNPVWNVGANLMMPLFQGGALKRQVEIRTVEQRQALFAYAGVGLRAFGEVENALSNEIAAREREAILAQTLADNQRAFELVRTQFEVGKTDLRFVSQRQLALNATRSSIIRMQAEQRVQRVNLHLALGGAFGPPPPQP
jgi:NodT family efflux transporter outer membrane factor (OMF) lipoprotein